MQWMWAIPGIPIAIAAYALLYKINTRKPETNTHGLYLTVWLLILALFAFIFFAVS